MAGRNLWWSCFLVPALVAGCGDLTRPHDEKVTALPELPPPTASAPPPQAPAPAPSPTPPPAALSLRAAHIVIAYKGAKGAPAKAARTKSQAHKLADDLAKRAAKEDFGKLAKQFSDDAATAKTAGDLGALTPSTAPKPVYDAASALKPGAVSPSSIEAEDGFHVVKRLGP